MRCSGSVVQADRRDNISMSRNESGRVGEREQEERRGGEEEAVPCTSTTISIAITIAKASQPEDLAIQSRRRGGARTIFIFLFFPSMIVAFLFMQVG